MSEPFNFQEHPLSCLHCLLLFSAAFVATGLGQPSQHTDVVFSTLIAELRPDEARDGDDVA